MLLDSHVLLWLTEDSPRLGLDTRGRMNSATRRYYSAASIWELRIKQELGKLELPDSFVQLLRESGLTELPVTSVHAHAIQSVKLPHRDPFDRLLVAQAVSESIPLVTADGKLLATDIDVIDARR